jgi:3-methylcrotonyl-CoA carboxylase alpha subunit
VPLVPGFHGVEQEPARLEHEAAGIGYPVLIKASAGGGGKGMRVVEKPADFRAALASCQREARSSFGDDRVLIERYLTKPRHIEIQVFADARGACVYLFERDCSVQRRHQKVLEEAPAPGMTAERRRAMGRAAVAAARAVGYVGAGTVEFIVDTTDPRPDAFFFMEMNTRLQVEHPVTEMITGLDLVEWQLRVAAGEPLGVTQEELALSGHALEARIYAEDPAKDFLPSVGRITHLATPAAVSFTVRERGDASTEPAAVRIDSGVRSGDAISPFYDPMIAKLIVWGPDRPAALRRMELALAQYQVAGVTTNIEFLSRVVAHPAFATADLDTGLIARHRAALIPGPAADPDALAAAALAEIVRLADDAQRSAAAAADRWSPWHARDGWWLNQSNPIELTFACDGTPHRISLTAKGDHTYRMRGEGVDATARVTRSVDGYDIVIADRRFHASVATDGALRTVFIGARATRFVVVDPYEPPPTNDIGSGHLLAPMSGTVIAVHVKAGDTVAKGSALLVLEAMKMEHTIVAPIDGTLERLALTVGDRVVEGTELFQIR